MVQREGLEPPVLAHKGPALQAGAFAILPPLHNMEERTRVERAEPFGSSVFKTGRLAHAEPLQTWRYTMELNHCAISDTPIVFEAIRLSVDGVYQTGGKQ